MRIVGRRRRRMMMMTGMRIRAAMLGLWFFAWSLRFGRGIVILNWRFAQAGSEVLLLTDS